MLVCADAGSTASHAHAGITLTLPDEQETDNAKVCIYSNANLTETVTIRASEYCIYSVTFEED